MGGLVGVTGFLLVDWAGFQRQPNNLEALENLATMRQRGQFDQAVTLTAKTRQQEPGGELRLQLAELYEHRQINQGGNNLRPSSYQAK